MSTPPARGPMRRRRKAVFIVAVGALVAGALAAFMGAASASPTKAPWLDPHKPIQARVNALLGAMTLPEKVGQMDQQLVDNLTGPSSECGGQGWAKLNQDCMKTWLVDNKTGSLLAGGTDNPPDTTGHGGSGNTGYDWANEYNMIQQYAIQNSRLHIPLIFGVDAVHGFGHPWQAPLYPQSIGMGATWDPSAARAGGAATADAVRATGWNWVFAPVQDLARDNRWGRTYETWAEEPVLSAAMGGANIQGMQAHGPAGSLGVAATVKHFAGYSQSINGHDRNEALLPLSYLQSVILPSYAGGIDAGARTVMVDSGSINGVPATGSHYLLTDILRNQMHFQGVVISDYQDVQALQTAYHVAANPAEAIAEAVNAGVDMAMYVTGADQWQTAILQDVQSHLISMARINQAVGRILTLKFQLGLFDQPCVGDPSKPCVDANAANAAVTAGRAGTLQAAQESMTLLRNQNNTLPLSSSAKVVVTGPSADSMTNQLGGWSVSWQGVFGAGHVCCMGPPDQIPPGTTVQKGILNDDSNAVSTCRTATPPRPRPPTPTSWRSVRRRTPKGWATTRHPNCRLTRRRDQDARGHRQAGDRRRHRRTSGRPGAGCRECERDSDGIPRQHRGRPGSRRRDLRQDRPERQAADQLAVRRRCAGRGLRRLRTLTAGRPAEVLRPAPGHRIRAGARLQPALPVRVRPVLHHVHDDWPLGDSECFPPRHGDRDVHCQQHRKS